MATTADGTATDPRSGAGTHRWFAVVRGDGTADRIVTVTNADRPRLSRYEMTWDQALAAAGDDLAVVTTMVGPRVTALALGPRFGDVAALWWVEVRESAARPPAVNLLAFSGHGVEPGTLLDETALSNLDIRSEDQVAALRWYPGSGEVDQLYVQPGWRRRGVSRGLIDAAAALVRARDWPRLWSGGRRTELGEAMRSTASWQDRSAPLSNLAPPMTPVRQLV